MQKKDEQNAEISINGGGKQQVENTDQWQLSETHSLFLFFLSFIFTTH